MVDDVIGDGGATEVEFEEGAERVEVTTCQQRWRHTKNKNNISPYMTPVERVKRTKQNTQKYNLTKFHSDLSREDLLILKQETTMQQNIAKRYYRWSSRRFNVYLKEVRLPHPWSSSDPTTTQSTCSNLINKNKNLESRFVSSMYRVWIDWKPTSNERHAVVCKLYVAQAQFSQTKERKRKIKKI